MAVLIGTAGWSLPRIEQPRFATEGTHLTRYAGVLNAAEINSSFYRPLSVALYARWAASVPDHFRFSVKLPKTITHERRLIDCDEPLCAFLDQVQALGDKLGCILIQLPPSLQYHPSLAGAFLEMFRAIHDSPLALEPRHASWFTETAARQMTEYNVARVAADPPIVAAASVPGGTPGLAYFRLHGSPRIYWSRYDDEFLDTLATNVAASAANGATVWCIFDNTASGSALPNALALMKLIDAAERS